MKATLAPFGRRGCDRAHTDFNPRCSRDPDGVADQGVRRRSCRPDKGRRMDSRLQRLARRFARVSRRPDERHLRRRDHDRPDQGRQKPRRKAPPHSGGADRVGGPPSDDGSAIIRHWSAPTGLPPGRDVVSAPDRISPGRAAGNLPAPLGVDTIASAAKTSNCGFYVARRVSGAPRSAASRDYRSPRAPGLESKPSGSNRNPVPRTLTMNRRAPVGSSLRRTWPTWTSTTFALA